MNDHQLGAALRQQVLSDLQRGRGAEGRRLQAVAGDLCGEGQSNLLPALRHLVMSAAFASAASQNPPLSEARLQQRLMQEVEEVFTPAICRRMESVMGGLLDLPAKGASTPTATKPAAPAPAPAAATPVPAPASSRGGNSVLLGFLAFLTGGLAVALVGAVVLLRYSPQGSVENPSATRPSTPPPPVARPTTPPEEPSLPTPEPPTTPMPSADTDLAIASIRGLYGALNTRAYDQARQFFAGAAGDQFDPAFFNQFERVSVEDLRETAQEGSTVSLQGLVTFVYPDGSSQTESRSFTVDTASTPALITASEFAGVIKAR
jgi:hypothetical protein